MRIRLLVKKPYTIVELYNDDKFYGIGIARCSSSDNWSPKKGVRIAVARALENHWKLVALDESGGDRWKINGWPDRGTAVAYASAITESMCRSRR